MPKHQIFITRSKWVYIIQCNTVQYNGSNRNNVDFVVCWCVEFHCECVSIYNISVIIWNRPFHLPKFVEFLVVCFTSYFILFSFSIYLLWFFHMKYCAIHLFRVDALKNWYTTCVLSTSHYLFLYIKQLRDFIICFSLVSLWNCLLFLVHNE